MGHSSQGIELIGLENGTAGLPVRFETVSALQNIRVRRQKDTKVVLQQSRIWVSRDALRRGFLDYVRRFLVFNDGQAVISVMRF